MNANPPTGAALLEEVAGVRRIGDAMEGHGLILAFDSDDPEFARGFEAGRLWAQLRGNPDEPFNELIHARNAELVLRMAEATGRHVRADEVGDDWLEVVFGASEGVPEV